METTPNGKFDARFVLHHVDTTAKKVFIDVEVKAHDANTTFRISDMNWRFMVNNRNAIKPDSVTLEKGLTLYGYTPQTVNSETFHSFYEPHTITGSIDVLVSYNVVLNGQGYLLSNETWTSVGRLSFDVEDTTETVTFAWNKRADFPPTFVGQIIDNQLYAATEGNYEDLKICLGDHFLEDAENKATGHYDLRFHINEVDLTKKLFSVDIELKADCLGSVFNLSEQNYRFSISNTKAIDPASVQIEELTLSGLVATRVTPTNGEIPGRMDTNSFYGPHTTHGSKAHIISYNIELKAGEGYPLEFEEWVKVGRLTFDILDETENFELIWHKHETFPPCFIGEKHDNKLYEAKEADYQDQAVNFAGLLV